jgi:TatD DNase family protein
LDALRKLADNPKCVGIGEIGLDYTVFEGEKPDKARQERFFREQLALSRELNLPVVIHSRDAAEDTLRILREECAVSASAEKSRNAPSGGISTDDTIPSDNVSTVPNAHIDGVSTTDNRNPGGVSTSSNPHFRGVVHCYSYSPEVAKILLELGFHISFTGVITFKNARKTLESLAAVPVERLLTETDCPYMSPEPERGKRNDSGKIPYIIAKIAEIHGLSPEKIAEQTMKNADNLFNFPI